MKNYFKSIFILVASSLVLACTPVDEIVKKERIGSPTTQVVSEQCFEEWEYKTKYRMEDVFEIKKVSKKVPVYTNKRVSKQSCTTSNGKRSCKTTYTTKKVKSGTKTVMVDKKVKIGTKKVSYKERVADYGEQEVTYNVFQIRTTYESGKVIDSSERERVSETECD